MTTACTRAWGPVGRGALLALAIVGAAATAEAGDPNAKDLFRRDAPAAAFTVSIARDGQTIEARGVAETADGGLWVTGSIECNDGLIICGYLGRIAPDGTLAEEFDIALPTAVETTFWWAVPVGEDRVAVAVVTDPYTDMSDGGLLILGADGAVQQQVMLTDLGFAGGEIVHVDTYANGDFALTGSLMANGQLTEGLVARLTPELETVWVQTDRARQRDYLLSGYVSAPLPDGSVAAVGASTDADYIHGYGWLARFDATGTQLWRQWLTGSAADLLMQTSSIYGNWVDDLPNGNIAYIQTGFDEWGEATVSVLGVVDQNGDVVSQTPLSFAEDLSVFGVAAARNGDMLVTGEITGMYPVLARVDPTGTILWNVTLEDLPEGYPWGIMEAADGSVIAVGTYYPDTRDETAGWVVRLPADGGQS